MTTWFITGAVTGLGRALAEEVLTRGDAAVLTGHELGDLPDLAALNPSRSIALTLDVTRPDQRSSALAAARAHLGPIDVLVNNAAIDYVGAIEEQTDEHIRAQFEVNLFGPLALIRAALPEMRARRTGTIVNISSMDGIASLPGNAIYSATKFALEGLTEALWQEIEPIGLRAMLIEPGSFRTGIEHRTNASGTAILDYADTGGAFRAMLGQLSPEMFPGDPQRAATVIYDTVRNEPDRRWLVLGSDARRRIQIKLDAFTRDLNRDVSMPRSPTSPTPDPPSFDCDNFGRETTGKGAAMIKLIAMLVKRADIEIHEVIKHYEQHHVPLILSLAPPPFDYRRNYLRRAGEVAQQDDVDIITELTFVDEPTYRDWVASMYAPGSGVAADEETFLDRTRTRSYLVEEHPARL